MKLALVTDLQSNPEAITAVMAHAESRGGERFAFIGDFAGYGADPSCVIDLVRKHLAHGAIVVMGNHDQAVVQETSPNVTFDARFVADWTRAQLSADPLGFLSNLPMLAIDGEMLFVPANANAPSGWGYIGNLADAVPSLQTSDRRFTFCGHVHEPRLFHMTAMGRPARSCPDGTCRFRRRHRGVRWRFPALPSSLATVTPQPVMPASTQPRQPSGKVRAAGLPKTLAQRLIYGG